MVFKFRLDKVLMMRQEAVDKARLEVVDAALDLTKAQKALDDNIREIKQRSEDLIKNNYDMAQDHLRVIKVMQILQKKLRDNVKSAKYRLEKAKKDLLEAQMKLEALQKLKEKQTEEYYLEENLLEQKETDERVSLKFATDMLQNAQELEEN
jgi:flagellar protein FliJ